jgi:hypothetical protein
VNRSPLLWQSFEGAFPVSQHLRVQTVDHVDVVTPEGELVGEITLNPETNYQPIVRSRPL